MQDELLAELELLRFLDGSVNALSSSLDWTTLLARLARASQSVADWSLVDIIEENHHIVRAAVAHADPQREQLLQTLGCRLRPGAPGIMRAVESARAQLAAGEPGEDDGACHLSRTATALGAEDLTALAKLDARSHACIPLQAGGRVIGVVTVVSARARLDERAVERLTQLCRRAAPIVDNARRHRELQRTLKQRQDSLAIVAHDLQNPLATIRLSLELLLTTQPENDRRRVGRAQLNLSRRAAQWMSRITTRLSNLSAGNSQPSEPVRNPHFLTDLIDDAIAILEPLAMQKSLDLRPELPDLLRVECDGEQLFRVLSNLIGTAIQSSPPGGVVTVRAQPDDDKVWISIEHSGPGLAEHELGALFERGGEGARLGLLSAKTIVEDHGGRIWVEGGHGLGTRFNFTVPSATSRFNQGGHGAER